MTYQNGLLRSTNNGTTWTPANTGFAADTVPYDLAISGTSIFAGTNDGVFLSTNNGDNWNAVNAGLPALRKAWCLAASGSMIYARIGDAQNSSGLWKRPLSEMVGVIDRGPAHDISRKVNLRTRFTGAHGAGAAVEFSLSHAEWVAVTVHDLSGREVGSLVNSHLAPGPYVFPWDARRIAPGYYTVRMRVGTSVYVASTAVFR